MQDIPLQDAARLISHARLGSAAVPTVRSFFDEPTNTVSYVVHDPATREAAVIDSVLDYDAAAGRTSFASADALIAYVRAEGLTVVWLLETHAHADHLSAAPYLKAHLGGQLAIGREIIHVQTVFGKIFNAGAAFARDGSGTRTVGSCGTASFPRNIPRLRLGSANWSSPTASHTGPTPIAGFPRRGCSRRRSMAARPP